MIIIDHFLIKDCKWNYESGSWTNVNWKVSTQKSLVKIERCNLSITTMIRKSQSIWTRSLNPWSESRIRKLYWPAVQTSEGIKHIGYKLVFLYENATRKMRLCDTKHILLRKVFPKTCAWLWWTIFPGYWCHNITIPNQPSSS